MASQNVSSVNTQTEHIRKTSLDTSHAEAIAYKRALKQHVRDQRRWQLTNCSYPRWASIIPQSLGGGLSFTKDYGLKQIGVPCGKCRVCRKKRAREWAIRLEHESYSYSNETVFLTLTYNPESLEGTDHGLNYSDIQLFLKKLRYHGQREFRYFVAGEYGAATTDPLQGLRPHWHLIIYGHNFIEEFGGYTGRWQPKTIRGRQYFIRNKLLERCWPHGNHAFNDYEPGAGFYVAQYVTKKLGGEPALDKYWRVNGGRQPKAKIDGWWVTPEMSRQSKGIGKRYYESHEAQIRQKDCIEINGHKHPVPRYYDKLYAQKHGDKALDEIHKKRIKNALVKQDKTLDIYDDEYIWNQKVLREHDLKRTLIPREGNHSHD